MRSVVRKAVEADCEAIAEQSTRMAKETEDLTLDAQTVRAGTEELLKSSVKGTIYVLEMDGKLAGQMMITFEWSDWRNANMWWIQSVYIKPEFRRQGFFKQLYNHVKAEASAVQAGGLRLYVDKGNARAQATIVHEKLTATFVQYEAMGMKSHYLVYEESFCGF